MSWYALYTADDTEPQEADFSVSNTGWHDFGSYLMAHPDEYPEGAHLATFHWSDQWDALESELDRAQHECDDPDLAAVAAQLLAAVRSRPEGAGGLVVTDGEPGEDEGGGLTESLLESAPGPPPRPGLVWNDETHRWRDPHSGVDHDSDNAPATFRLNTFYPGAAERMPAVLKAIIGPHAELHHGADALGAGPGDSVRLSQARQLDDGTYYVGATVSTADGVSGNRSLHYDPASGKKWIVNDTVSAENPAQGAGTALFARQVAAASALGFDHIEAGADRGAGKNGYYTLPRWGYDGEIPDAQRAKLPPELADAKTLLDLMATPEGREWWKKNGVPVEVKFDLRPGSRSQQVLAAYLAERAGRAKSEPAA